MAITYLQCDCRYNKWLLEKINGKLVIEHTVDRIRKLECKKIIAGIYKCNENEQLIQVLKKLGISVVISNEKNVNIRFLELVIKENADYVIRISGDQVLLDTEKIMNILEDMKKQSKEFFFESGIASVVADIVSINCLIKYKESILKEDRYFNALLKEKDVERYMIYHSDIVLFDFRVNSNEGYRVCKRVLENNLDVYDLSKKLAERLNYRTNYLNQSGIWGSWILADECEDFFFDEDGIVNPWLGRSVVDFLKKRLKRDFRVFEWGGGNSTLFWSHYVEEVVSVEHNFEWYEKIKKVIPDNVELQYCELEYGGEYCHKILDEKNLFDIVVIDGRDRVNCAINAVNRLSEKGIIIWDNSDRDEYTKGYEFLKKHGFKRLEISSIIYGLPGVEDFTSIFYRKDNILDL